MSTPEGVEGGRLNVSAPTRAGPGFRDEWILETRREAALCGFDKRSGAEKGSRRSRSEMLASPVTIGDQLIVQTIDGKISVYNASTGKSIWTYSRSIPKLTLRGTSAPVVVGDKIVAGFSDGRLVGLSLATGELLWETPIAVPRGRTDLERLVDIDGLFHIRDDVVYVSSFQGRVAAIVVSDGNVLWARDMSSYTGLAVGVNQVYVTDCESKVWALDGRTGATLWRQDNLAERELSAPAVVGNNIVVADYDGFVHWLSRDDGQFVARDNLGVTWEKVRYVWDDEEQDDRHRSVTVLPLAIENTLYVRDNIGALTAFQVMQ